MSARSPTIALRAGDFRAEIAPQIGGSVLALSLAGRAILRPTPEDAVAGGEVRRTGCYPLVPYANRIDRGRFVFGGREFRLRRNFPEGDHPLHGLGWQRPWRVVSVAESRCELALEHRPAGDDALDWPFAFDVREVIELSADGLSIALEATNRECFAAPLGLGLHPLFPRRPGQSLEFSAAGYWRNGADQLPCDAVEDARGGDRRLPIGEASIDNDFYGWSGEADLIEIDGFRVRLRADAGLPVLRVFVPPGRDFIGIEPVGHIADAINRPGLVSGRMAIVAAGAAIGGAATIGVEAAA
ncbi:MAG: aldose 1-epimerase [Gammaproteobacteria bacterium]|nr:aldose 1-epimerase [Gammaproteobacteria bacterium]